MLKDYISLSLFGLAAFIYQYRISRYTKIYFLNRFGIKLTNSKLMDIVFKFGVDYRLILCLPILKDKYMETNEINKSNLLLLLSLLLMTISIILDVAFK